MESNTLIDPDWAIRLTVILSWVMIALGLLKMIFWVIGEFFPHAYDNIKSKAAKKFMTGSGNRLVFGLLGFLTLLFGVFGLVAAAFMRWLLNSTPGV